MILETLYRLVMKMKVIKSVQLFRCVSENTHFSIGGPTTWQQAINNRIYRRRPEGENYIICSTGGFLRLPHPCEFRWVLYIMPYERPPVNGLSISIIYSKYSLSRRAHLRRLYLAQELDSSKSPFTMEEVRIRPVCLIWFICNLVLTRRSLFGNLDWIWANSRD